MLQTKSPSGPPHFSPHPSALYHAKVAPITATTAPEMPRIHLVELLGTLFEDFSRTLRVHTVISPVPELYPDVPHPLGPYAIWSKSGTIPKDLS